MKCGTRRRERWRRNSWPDGLIMSTLNGTWKGRWQSTRSKRGGKMSAVFVFEQPAQYRVTFRGWFLTIFPFWYIAKMDIVDATDECIHLSCTRHLGLWFGVFTATAQVTADHFVADYSALKDVGQFTLDRVGD